MTPTGTTGARIITVGAARPKDNEATRASLRRALELARQAVAIVDEVNAASVAGARGQHFVDEIEALLQR